MFTPDGTNRPLPQPSKHAAESPAPAIEPSQDYLAMRTTLSLAIVSEIRQRGGIALIQVAHGRLAPFYEGRDFSREWNTPAKFADFGNTLLPSVEVSRANRNQDWQYLKELGCDPNTIDSLTRLAESRVHPAMQVITDIAGSAERAELGHLDPVERFHLQIQEYSEAWQKAFPHKAGFVGYIRDLAVISDQLINSIRQEALNAMEAIEASGLKGLYGADCPYTPADLETLTLLVGTTKRDAVARREFIQVGTELLARALYPD